MRVQVRLNVISPYRSQQWSPAIQDISFPRHTRHLCSGHPSHLHSGRTWQLRLQPYETHLQLRPLYATPATPSPLLSSTPRLPRAIGQLACSALHLAARQSHSSLKLPTFTVQPGRLEQGALADKTLGNAMLRTLHSGAKDTTVAIAKDCRHLGKACVNTAENVVQLREEKERLDRENVAKAKMCQEKAAAQVVSSGGGSKSSKHVE